MAHFEKLLFCSGSDLSMHCKIFLEVIDGLKKSLCTTSREHWPNEMLCAIWSFKKAVLKNFTKFELKHQGVTWIAVVKIHPLVTLCWVNKGENIWPNKFSQSITENKFIVWNYHFSGPTSIYLFECSNINSRIKCKICVLVCFFADLEHGNCRYFIALI